MEAGGCWRRGWRGRPGSRRWDSSDRRSSAPVGCGVRFSGMTRARLRRLMETRYQLLIFEQFTNNPYFTPRDVLKGSSDIDKIVLPSIPILILSTVCGWLISATALFSIPVGGIQSTYLSEGSTWSEVRKLR